MSRNYYTWDAGYISSFYSHLSTTRIIVYGHYTGEPVLDGTPSYELDYFAGAWSKVLLPRCS